MRIARRVFALLLVLPAPVILFSSPQTTEKAAKSQFLVYVGTYTTKTNSKGIYVYRFDVTTGKLSAGSIAAETPDPSWVAVHPNGKFLYAVNEAGKNSMVSAFALDAKTGKLTLLNQLPALGEDPCYISFDDTGKYVFVANYTSGNVVVFPISADGKLGSATANVHDDGKLGPNKERQEASHAHWIEVESTGGMGSFVHVADLGLDRVLTYQFHAAKGELSGPTVFSAYSNRKFDPSAKLSPGTGPRHGVFSRAGERMYVLGELNSTVTVFHMMGTDDFVPTAFQQISALPDGFNGRNDAAEIALHPNGMFLYTSNRGEDTIALFSIKQADGTLKRVVNFPTGGKEPRHFAIDPSGNYLLAENQLSNNIVVFKIDTATGSLTPTGQVVDVTSPVSIAFLPVE
jgi:6-phosphogluconolactonase